MVGGNSPVLLTKPDYYGTLAAARRYGRAGISVTMADGLWLAPARWSRYVSRSETAPPPTQDCRFLEWLIAFGASDPGHVLYPTGDRVAFLCALRRDELARNFLLYQPGIDQTYAILNKKRLYESARSVGIDFPQTWFPASDKDLDEIEAEACFPVLLKPQTQVGLTQPSKGRRVERAAHLRTEHEAFLESHGYQQFMLDFDAGVRLPMVQQYHPEAANGIYTLSGFLDETGELLCARAAVKVLQRPRQLGIGLCFEDAPVDDALLARLVVLCRKVGYHGVFEVEFIRIGDRPCLIDFNPRYYSQMAFDVDRGMPLPLMVYHAARGDSASLSALVASANAWKPERRHIYCHRLIFKTMLLGQRMSGAFSRQEVSAWRAWLDRYQDGLTEAVAAPDDRLPALVDTASIVTHYLKHPRDFLHKMAFNQ